MNNLLIQYATMAIFTTHSVNQKQFVPEYGNLFILLGCTPNQRCLLKADIQNMIRIKSSEKRDSIFQPEFPRLRIKSNECLISLKCVIRTYEIYISFIFQTSIQCNYIIYICAILFIYGCSKMQLIIHIITLQDCLPH